MMGETAKSIAAKLVLVSRACAYLQKTGKAPQYRYVPGTAYLERVNEVLAQHGLAITETDMSAVRESDPPGAYATVKVSVVLTDTESGETARFSGVGAAYDQSSKLGGKAVSMAVTDAYKKLWTVALSIASGEDSADDYAEEATLKSLSYDLGFSTTDEAVALVFVRYRERIEALSEDGRKAGRTAVAGALKRLGRDGAWLKAWLTEREVGPSGAP